jgi:tRNA threonylcarbamoyladenosine biosynthesis protein TsaE
MEKQLNKLLLKNSDDTKKLGAFLAQAISTRLFVCLKGDLGAGKTTFVQAVAQGLGIDELVTSPTFTTLNEYHSGKLPLFHIDLYRMREDLADDDEGVILDSFIQELNELLEQDCAVFIEWPEAFEQYLPEDRLIVELEYATEGDCRLCTLSAKGTRSYHALKQVEGMLNS